jgi:hypothetical protein
MHAVFEVSPAVVARYVWAAGETSVTPEFDRWLWRQRWTPPPAVRGRWTRFEQRAGLVMYKPAYNVYSIPQGGMVSGGGLWIGKVEWRNQWGTFAFYPDADVMFNKEILAEIYALLRDLTRGLRIES